MVDQWLDGNLNWEKDIQTTRNWYSPWAMVREHISDEAARRRNLVRRLTLKRHILDDNTLDQDVQYWQSWNHLYFSQSSRIFYLFIINKTSSQHVCVWRSFHRFSRLTRNFEDLPESYAETWTWRWIKTPLVDLVAFVPARSRRGEAEAELWWVLRQFWWCWTLELFDFFTIEVLERAQELTCPACTTLYRFLFSFSVH